MIVRNEAHCLRRCLESVLPYIDTAVIVDTGSTDGTQQLASEVLANRPHCVLQHEWVNFGVNRTKAFWAAVDAYKEGYAFVMDADEEFLPGPGFQWPEKLDRSGYAIWQAQGQRRFLQPRLLRLSEPWVYQGAIHEEADCLTPDASRGIIEGCHITGHFDSARNQQGKEAKCLADAQVMETVPDTPRNVFHKAQCYRNAGKLDRALELYEQRSEMGGFEEEVWASLLLAAHTLMVMGKPPSWVAMAFEKAYMYRPSRAEAPYYLSKFLEMTGHPAAGHFARIAAAIPMTTDQQFIDLECYGPTRSAQM